MSNVVLIQAAPRDPATAIVTEVRVAGGGSGPYIHLGFSDWRSGGMSPLRFTVAIGFDQDGPTGAATPSTAGFRLSSHDAPYLSGLSSLFWRGAAITVHSGDDERPDTITAKLVGKVAGMTAEGGAVALTVSDLSGALDNPVAGATFSGSGALEGDEEAAGRVKRRSYGEVYGILGTLIDKAYSIYEFGDPSSPLTAFLLVKDKGRAASAMIVVDWQGSQLATLNALRAAAAPAGGCAVAPSIACVKWYTAPVGPITADLIGRTNGGGYSAPHIADLIRGEVAPEIASGDLVAAYNARPYPAGLHVDSGTETAAQALDRLLLPLFLAWIVQPNATMAYRRIEWTPPVRNLLADTIRREAVFAPHGTRTVGYQRNHRPHGESEISAAITADDVLFPDGSSAADLADIVAEQGREIDAVVSDSVLSRPEKTIEISRYDDLIDQQRALDAKYVALGSPPELNDARNAATAFINALTGYLNGLVPPFRDTTADTAIVKDDYANYWRNALAALSQYVAAITGRPGRDGVGAFTAYLTNADQTLPALFDGTVTSYAGAEAVFVIRLGATDLTDSGQFALSIVDNPQNLTVATSGRYFRVDGGLDAGEDSASLTVRLTGSGQYAGVVIDQLFTLSKSKGGRNGEPAALIDLTASAQTAAYDTVGALKPGQAITYHATRQNTTARTLFTLRNSAGAAVHGPYEPGQFAQLGGTAFWSAVDADTITLTEAGIIAVLRDHGGTSGRVTMIASLEGTPFASSVSLARVTDGAKGDRGEAAPLIRTQWSVNGVDGWHDTFFGADAYARQSNDGGLNYGPAYRAVGEGGTIGADGTSPSIVFLRSATVPATPTNNSGNPPSGWSDAPPPGDEILWQSKATFKGTTQTVAWSAPVRITGPAGRNAVNVIADNETFTVPTDAAGGYAAFPIDVSRGHLRVYDGATEVTGQCTFTAQNPFWLGSYIDAAGAYYSDYLGNDTGYSDLIAIYRGQAYSARITASKVKGGAKGTDGINPPLVSVSAAPQAISYDRDNNLSSGPTTFTANLVNAIGPVGWRSAIGHGIYDTPGVTFSGNTMTWSPERMRDVLAYNLANFGRATETIIATASGQSDSVTVTKIRDGAKGADSVVPGPPGADGYSLIASPPAFVVPSFSNGTSKPAWNGGSCRIALIKGGVEIGADAYSYVAVSNISSIAMSGQSVTFGDVIGDKGEFTARATRGGVNYDLRVTVVRTKDGSAAFQSSTPFNSQAGYVDASANTTVPGGRTVTLTATASYGAPLNAEGRGRLTLYWRNRTDNGEYNYVGQADGTVAYSYNTSGNPNEPEYENVYGSASVSGTFASPSPDKLIEYRVIYQSLGQTSNVSGNLKLEVTS